MRVWLEARGNDINSGWREPFTRHCKTPWPSLQQTRTANVRPHHRGVVRQRDSEVVLVLADGGKAVVDELLEGQVIGALPVLAPGGVR